MVIVIIVISIIIIVFVIVLAIIVIVIVSSRQPSRDLHEKQTIVPSFRASTPSLRIKTRSPVHSSFSLFLSLSFSASLFLSALRVFSTSLFLLHKLYTRAGLVIRLIRSGSGCFSSDGPEPRPLEHTGTLDGYLGDWFVDGCAAYTTITAATPGPRACSVPQEAPTSPSQMYVHCATYLLSASRRSDIFRNCIQPTTTTITITTTTTTATTTTVLHLRLPLLYDSPARPNSLIYLDISY